MISVTFLGDTLLGGVAQPVLDQFGPDYALGGIAPLLADSDLVVINHEGPLTTQSCPAAKGDTGRKRYWYRGEPESASALASVGVGVASLANNHVLDYGQQGLTDTIQNLNSAGIATCGAGPDRRTARRPAIVDVGGTRIGFLSVMQRYRMYEADDLYATDSHGGPARLVMGHLRNDLAALRPNADFIVLLVHWGRNYRDVTPQQERLALRLAELDVDLIVGHHPHIAQRVDQFGTTPVLFSLGNGVLGTPGRFHSGRPPWGLVARVEISDDFAIAGIGIRPILIENEHVAFRPELASTDAADQFVNSLGIDVAEMKPAIAADSGPPFDLSAHI
jgi:poly-gamma-glutamate capsule biosynthesis protein CapA/YwtB (metallophosphatase superfamily)